MSMVTSLVEVWIEIAADGTIVNLAAVTSLVEVWIEIGMTELVKEDEESHFPCGSVD